MLRAMSVVKLNATQEIYLNQSIFIYKSYEKKKCSRKYSRILWERLPGFFLKSFMNPSNPLWDCSAENLEIISEFSSRYRFGIHPK